MLKLIVLFVFVTAAFAQYQYDSDNQIAWWDTDDNKENANGRSKTIPFPQCLLSGSSSGFLQSKSLQRAFDKAINDEQLAANREYQENNRKYNNDKVDDYDADDDNGFGPGQQTRKKVAAAAAIKLTTAIMTKLACNLNGTDSKNLEKFLSQFTMAGDLCTSRKPVNCTLMSAYRMPNGLCNNLANPYEGNSHTAFGRLLSADYEDHISEPRQRSVRGGLLPSCRKISLALDSKPIFERTFNNHFSIFGQLIAHDIALSVPVTDTYSTPITSCTCDSKNQLNKCTVIPIQSDDPYLRGQKCMAFPATAQAFKDEICSLGVKEQLNGNTHFIDASLLYGSSKRMANALRGEKGLMKVTKRLGLYGSLPPGQREYKSCSDGTKKRKCFAGGDSRLSINLLMTGIHTILLRAHNDLATELARLNPLWDDNMIYEETKKYIVAYLQRTVYVEWLPKLLGVQYYPGGRTPNLVTKYNPQVRPIVYNEVATAAFRLHTLVRDLFSRCTPDRQRIDQLWLQDILHKVKYAYDGENNGLDSLLCGSFYDYGFAADGNFAHQIHHRLFETSTGYGQLWRNDLVSINICRAREHGIPGYTAFRKFCGLKKVREFSDLGDRINSDGIYLLKKVYKHVDDIDAFVGFNLEDKAPNAIVGPTSVCILDKQFRDLRDGDRLFYSHEGVLSPQCLTAIQNYRYACLVLNTVDIREVPQDAFAPPSEKNGFIDKSKCQSFTQLIIQNCINPVAPPVPPVIVPETPEVPEPESVEEPEGAEAARR